MRFFYTCFIRLYVAGIALASLSRPKARLWIKGRKAYRNGLPDAAPVAHRCIWFHAASLGEFEQGRPLIEAWKHAHPDWFILLSFFSPSGFEIRKNYDKADQVVYLPADTLHNARKFIQHFHPDIAVFVKYEFWFNYLKALKETRIPVYYVSVIFRPGQHFFRSWGGWFRKHLNTVRYFFVQQQESVELLQSIGIQNVIVSGDTRFDRVADIAALARVLPLAEQFKGADPLLVAGSTWPEDENLLLQLDCRMIIAPHEIEPERIEQLAQKYHKSCIRYSHYTAENPQPYDLLIIDNIGMLSSLYRYADLMYIGGGFGRGIHNILEAAAFGGPVFFGPAFEKFQEARDLVSLGGAFPVKQAEELSGMVQHFLQQPDEREILAQRCRDFVKSRQGATQIILQTIMHEQKR